MGILDDLEAQAIAGSDDALAVMLDHLEVQGESLEARKYRHAWTLLKRAAVKDPSFQHVLSRVRVLQSAFEREPEAGAWAENPDKIRVPRYVAAEMGLTLLRMRENEFVQKNVLEMIDARHEGTARAHWKPESHPYMASLVCGFGKQGWNTTGHVHYRAYRVDAANWTMRDYDYLNFAWIEVRGYTMKVPAIERNLGRVSGCGGDL